MLDSNQYVTFDCFGFQRIDRDLISNGRGIWKRGAMAKGNRSN
jgi:hypothetical protein